MLKKFFVALIVIGSIQCLAGTRARAQAGPNCLAVVYTSWIEGYLAIPPGAFNCQTYEFTSTGCWIVLSTCAPAAAASEICLACASAAAGLRVSLASGNVYIEENDVRIPGLGAGLAVDRIWNSLWPSTQTAYQIGLFGPNWRSTYEERVFIGADHYIKYGRADGTFWSFGYNAGVYSVAAPANVTATLVPGTTNWTLTFQNGEQRLFDNTTGHLTTIIDRNGNTTTLSYDSVGRLTTVTDAASRQLYFNYGGGSSYLVTSVTSSFGVTISYSYDNQGRLSQVTEPDSSTLNFQYDSNSFISNVLDSQGVVLESHSYDSSGHGLTSSRANGVEAISISYQ